MNYDEVLKQKAERFTISIKRQTNQKQLLKKRQSFLKQKLTFQMWNIKIQEATINLQDTLTQQHYNQSKIQQYFQQINLLIKQRCNTQYIDLALPNDIIQGMKIYHKNQLILQKGYLILMNLSGCGMQIYLQSVPFISLKIDNYKLVNFFVSMLGNIILNDKSLKCIQYVLNQNLVNQIIDVISHNMQLVALIQINLLDLCCILIQRIIDYQINCPPITQLTQKIKNIIFARLRNQNTKYYSFINQLISFGVEIPQQFLNQIQRSQISQLKLSILIKLSVNSFYVLPNFLVVDLVQYMFTKQKFAKKIMLLLGNNICNKPSSSDFILSEIVKPRKSIYSQLQQKYPHTVNFMRLLKQSQNNGFELSFLIGKMISVKGELGIFQQCVSRFLQQGYLQQQLRQMGVQIIQGI